MESVHHVSASSKVLFGKVRKIVPPMLEKFHKGVLSSRTRGSPAKVKVIDEGNVKLTVSTGQLGRVAVVGGCAE